jgi:hypothetical protein
MALQLRNQARSLNQRMPARRWAESVWAWASQPFHCHGHHNLFIALGESFEKNSK